MLETQTTMKRHIPRKGPEAYSPEWYGLRVYDPDREIPVVIGASEAAAACNQSPYSSALQLYLEKRGELQVQHDERALNRMDMGKRLEPIILDVYAERTDVVLERQLPLYLHPACIWMGATPDAIASQKDSEWSVDAKATGFRMIDKSGEDVSRFGEDGTDQIPVQYLFQAQQQMAVMGLDRCDFPVLVDARELRVYTVFRNDELIRQIIHAETELVERIIDGEPPEPNWSHEGTKKALAALFGDPEVGTVAILGEEEQDLWTSLALMKSHVKDLQSRIDETTARLTWAMAGKQIGRFPDADIELKAITVQPTIVPSYERAGYTYLKAVKAKKR